MGRRRLVTWRGVRGLLVFGGFGVLMSVGGAWGIRHAHFANGYPAPSRWSSSVEFVGVREGRLWRVQLQRKPGRWRYEVSRLSMSDVRPRLSGEEMRMLADNLGYVEPPLEEILAGIVVPRPLDEFVESVDPARVLAAREALGLPTASVVEPLPGWVESRWDGRTHPRTLTTGYGWPFPAMSEGVRNIASREVTRVWLWSPGNQEAQGLSQARLLVAAHEFGFPIRPVWWGLLANAVVFGGGLWMMVGGGRWAWRRHRYRRGTCRACGYDLAGLPEGAGCPECGEGKE